MSKESYRGQASGRRESRHGGPERSLYEAMKVKPGLCRRPQDARSVGHLPRRAAHRKWNQPERELSCSQ